MKSAKQTKKGMTLIEVLIAMVILSIGVTALMGSMSKCLEVVSKARDLENARTLFRLVDLENPLIRKKIEEKSDSGDFSDYKEFSRYSWEREIKAVDEEERPGLFLVTTRIRWAAKGRNTYEEITTYIYAPEAESVTRRF